ncbi:MAG: hypothetical protein LBN18_00635, partial [Dysgonamonadaceae bacterium]|nr:hypothetical protein [Dysgonamonadaceae bacterium]
MKISTTFCLLLSALSVFAQDWGKDYQVIPINKKVADISYENPYQSPESNYAARMHLWMNGQYDTVYSETIDAPVRKAERKPYPQQAIDNLLSSEMVQTVIYKDSIGLAFRLEEGSS